MPPVIVEPAMHPPLGGYPGGGGYNHPMWNAVVAGTIAAQQAANEAAWAQSVANANAAIIAASQQQAMAQASVKPAIDAHLTAASQILATPEPTPAVNASAQMHVVAAQQLLPQA